MIAAGFECPDDLYYLVDEQVWARPEADGQLTLGITALGVHLAGEVYMCRPKAVGTVLAQGQGVAVVELAKSIVSVKSAASGTVVAINGALADRPELVHRDPYGQGWLLRVAPAEGLAAWLAPGSADQAALLHGEPVAAAMAHHAWLHRSDGD